MTLEDKYKDMFEDGKEEGRAEGIEEAKATLICNFHRNGLSVAEIAKLAELTESEVTRIVQSATAE